VVDVAVEVTWSVVDFAVEVTWSVVDFAVEVTWVVTGWVAEVVCWVTDLAVSVTVVGDAGTSGPAGVSGATFGAGTAAVALDTVLVTVPGRSADAIPGATSASPTSAKARSARASR
jgi:hypothetical protein